MHSGSVRGLITIRFGTLSRRCHMREIKICGYPNNEVRVTMYSVRAKRFQESDSPLDIISKLEPAHKSVPVERTRDPKPGYGKSGKVISFSAYARRQLLRSGAALSTKCPRAPQECIFLTGTLPGSTLDAKRAIAQWSAYAVHSLKSWVSKRVPEKLDMYCWEFQKRGALHLHYAVWCPDPKGRQYIITHFKEQWTRILDAIGEKSGVDVWRKNANYTHANNKDVLQADAQECHKSIANYLAKYVSKSEQQRKNNHWRECYQSRLWGVSRPLLKLTRSLSTEAVFAIGRTYKAEAKYQEILSVLESYALKSYGYRVGYSDARVVVGYLNKEEVQPCVNILMGSLEMRNSRSLDASKLEEQRERCIQMSLYALTSHHRIQRKYLQDWGGRYSHISREILSLPCSPLDSVLMVLRDIASSVQGLRTQGLMLTSWECELLERIKCYLMAQSSVTRVQSGGLDTEEVHNTYPSDGYLSASASEVNPLRRSDQLVRQQLSLF